MTAQWTIWTTAMTSIFVTYAACSTITRYHQSPLPTCSADTVCSEISELPSLSSERNYFAWVSCRCSSGLACPKQPGRQTINTSDNKWYGMCKPISDMRPCMIGDIAEEIFVGVRELGMRSFKKVHCLCPSQEVGQYGTSSSNLETREREDDPRAENVYELICGDEQTALKRGGRGRGGFRKFYFY